MKYLKYLYLLSGVLLLAGCGTIKNEYTYGPEVNRFYMSDLVYLGETEIEVSYSSYFGLLKKIHTVNGKEYDSAQKQHVYLGEGFKTYGLNKAAYKVLEQFPEGRYFKVVRRTKTKDRLFLGAETQVKALVRVYKYKN
ncbi:MAG: hypothetical protein NC388_09740 [Clostridium sp.]|nr:hypothetical protein [Clostridium sp.]